MITCAVIYPLHVVDIATYEPVTTSHSFSRADTEKIYSTDFSYSDTELEESSQFLVRESGSSVTDSGIVSVTKSQSSLSARIHGNKTCS